VNLFRRQGAASFVLERTIDAPGVAGELIDPLAAGPIGVFDRANVIRVRLFGGALSSIGEEELLGGANAAAIGTDATGWEIVQFRDALLVGPQIYELRHLLRGQSGSEPEMQGAAPAGTKFVLLDQAVVQMNETLSDLGHDIVWRAGPVNRDHGDPSYVEFTHRAAALGLRPLSPVHLKAQRDGSDVVFTWIRRARIDGDSWELAEVPLGEASEAYAFDILDGSTPVRSVTVTAPTYRYIEADQLADFGAPQSAFTVRVGQLGHEFGRGSPLERTLNV
jgi:hypothetical protein